MSYQLERAYQDVQEHGRALLKYISRNEVSYRQSHQFGYLIPKSAAYLFTPHAAVKGRNDHHQVRILWPNGAITDSVLHWYGNGTRSEYRLTKFGKDFPYANNVDLVGQLLVLVPKTLTEFNCHILDGEDKGELLELLDVEIYNTKPSFAVYDRNVEVQQEDSDSCTERLIRAISQRYQSEVPPGDVITQHAWETLEECHRDLSRWNSDKLLIEVCKSEFTLYKAIERVVFSPRLSTVFESVDEFVAYAQRILQSRKSRAGRSVENHVDRILQRNKIPHTMRARIPGNPDVILPSIEAYNNPDYPADRIVLLAVKRTVKERWRQILEEGPRVVTKHLLTLEPTITLPQFRLMENRGIRLVVPETFHKQYPKETQGSLISIQKFMDSMKTMYFNG